MVHFLNITVTFIASNKQKAISGLYFQGNIRAIVCLFPICNLPANCWSVFDHFVKLALKGLTSVKVPQCSTAVIVRSQYQGKGC